MSGNTFNWCFIGAGAFARSAAMELTFIRNRSHKIVSVYSDSKLEAGSFVAFYGGKSFDTPDEAIGLESVDAVYISYEDVSKHFELAMKCLDMKKPVLIEKPMTLNYEQASTLFNRAEQEHIYLNTTTWSWFLPVFNQIREWIENGDIGEVKKCDIVYSQPNNPLKNNENPLSTLISVGTFPLSCCGRIFGKPEEIICTATSMENGVDMGDKITLKYPGGVVCNIDLSHRKFLGRENATFTGSNGIITLPLFHQVVKAKLMSSTKIESSMNFQRNSGPFDIVAKEIAEGLTHSEFLTPDNVLLVIKIVLLLVLLVRHNFHLFSQIVSAERGAVFKNKTESFCPRF